MTHWNNEAAAVAAVVNTYVDAARKGDSDLMASIFHPSAHMYGRAGETFFANPIAGFIRHVGKSPSPDASGDAYGAEIRQVTVTGDVAVVTLAEAAYQGHDYLDHFVLLKTPQGWQIVTKGFAVVR